MKTRIRWILQPVSLVVVLVLIRNILVKLNLFGTLADVLLAGTALAAMVYFFIHDRRHNPHGR